MFPAFGKQGSDKVPCSRGRGTVYTSDILTVKIYHTDIFLLIISHYFHILTNILYNFTITIY